MKHQSSILARLGSRLGGTPAVEAPSVTPILQHHLDHVAGGECSPHSSKCSHSSECESDGTGTSHRSMTECLTP